MEKDPTSQPSREGELSFEDIITRLSRVVDRLEGGDLPLEQSLAMFEEGILLTRLGARRLDEAEARVEQLLSDESGVSTRRLSDEETE